MNSGLESTLSFVLNGLWRASWQASVLAIVVLVIQKMLGRRLGGRGRFALWAVVLVRLLLPVMPESRFSVFNLAKTRAIETPKPVVEASIVAPVQKDIPIIVIGPGGSTGPQAAEVAPIVKATVVAPVQTHSWGKWIFAAWIAGVLTLALRVAQVCWELSLTIRTLKPTDDPELLDIVHFGATKLKLRRIPKILIGDTVQTPAVVGLLGAKLLLPVHVLEHCTLREKRLIILHELAHLKRHDIAGNWLIAVASILHWFNPIVWLIASRMRADREMACDELVLAHASDEAKVYGHTLVKLIEILSPQTRSLGPAPRQLAFVGILESTTPMQRRVRMIAQFDPKLSGRWIWSLVVLVLLGTLTLTDAVRGESKPKPAATQPAPNASLPEPAGKLQLLNSAATPAPEDKSVELETKGYDLNEMIRNSGQERSSVITSTKHAIESLVEAQSWVDNGGNQGVIEEVNGKLIVKQTPAAHQKIGELLTLLQSGDSSAPPAQPAGAFGGVPGGMMPGASPISGVMPSAAHTVVSDEEIETANRQALAVLKKKLPEVKFENMALSDVIDFYRDLTGANIVVSWRRLEEAGIDRSAQISLRLRDTTFETALQGTLRQLGGPGLIMVIDRGVITITTYAEMPSFMLTKTYDVSNLAKAPDEMASLVNVMQSLAQAQEGGLGVQSFGSKLIITALPSAHEQVEKLLANLRTGSTTQPVAKNVQKAADF